MFLALGGLFTAHITGNLVIVAAHYVSGGFGQIGPILAVPVFIAVLGVLTQVFAALGPRRHGRRRPLLLLHAGLIAACLGLGVGFGPFADVDGTLAVLVGMLGVAAMATQNALVRLAVPGAPSTAAMTTNITQVTVDVATVVWNRAAPDHVVAARRRAGVTLPCVVGFIGGCAIGAVLEVHAGLWALALPAVLAVLAVALGELGGDQDG